MRYTSCDYVPLHRSQLDAMTVLFFYWLLERPSNMQVYLRNGAAQTGVDAATLR